MPHANSTTSWPRAISPSASRSTLPCSAVMIAASSSRRELSSSRNANSTCVRRASEVRSHASAASAAAAMTAVGVRARGERDLAGDAPGRGVGDVGPAAAGALEGGTGRPVVEEFGHAAILAATDRPMRPDGPYALSARVRQIVRRRRAHAGRGARHAGAAQRRPDRARGPRGPRPRRPVGARHRAGRHRPAAARRRPGADHRHRARRHRGRARGVRARAWPTPARPGCSSSSAAAGTPRRPPSSPGARRTACRWSRCAARSGSRRSPRPSASGSSTSSWSRCARRTTSTTSFTELSLEEAEPDQVLAAVRAAGRRRGRARERGAPGARPPARHPTRPTFVADWERRSRSVRQAGRTTWDRSNGWLVTQVGRPRARLGPARHRLPHRALGAAGRDRRARRRRARPAPALRPQPRLAGAPAAPRAAARRSPPTRSTPRCSAGSGSPGCPTAGGTSGWRSGRAGAARLDEVVLAVLPRPRSRSGSPAWWRRSTPRCARCSAYRPRTDAVAAVDRLVGAGRRARGRAGRRRYAERGARPRPTGRCASRRSSSRRPTRTARPRCTGSRTCTCAGCWRCSATTSG